MGFYAAIDNCQVAVIQVDHGVSKFCDSDAGILSFQIHFSKFQYKGGSVSRCRISGDPDRMDDGYSFFTHFYRRGAIIEKQN